MKPAHGRPARPGDAPAARMLLHDLGVDPTALDRDHRVCHGTVSAWGSPDPRHVHFINDPHGHGWHLHRPAFDHLLRSRARACDVRVAEHTTVGHPVRDPGGGRRVTVTARGVHRPLRCRWLVDATGRRARVATRCGASRHRHDRLIAVHLRLADDPHDREHLSLVESAPDGWWYTAPCHPTGRLAAYFTHSDLAPPRLNTLDVFLDRLATTTHTAARAVGRTPWPGAVPRRCAAHTARLRPAAGDGWIAVGDAATAYDPISSQGILTALYTGVCGAEAVHARLDGDPDALARYAARLHETFEHYLLGHRAVHSWERRRPAGPFWRRRQAPTATREPLGRNGLPGSIL
ncbi:NAD(P)/FAD-dependent oxidoreductase [Streptomyces misionensis]|uniref:NAD(P)/FAD-dependent oxidoreductase n=1 Tax=Streptomyces misionensis TaxID=67331 RepID=A0A5C6JBH6_9ACTN|nr:NAD(P)/FAD-dependent oxidoreductase [Streptomyces misionensis]TWV38551.1 NAD(P)/FAD-dependent oxidoreductase [Streptomyces misionensis]